MREDLVFDVEALGQLASDLGLVKAEFENAETTRDQISGAVGHPSLASAVRTFSNEWDDKRAKMAEAIEFLAEATPALLEALIQFDQEGANALLGQGEAPRAVSGGSSIRAV